MNYYFLNNRAISNIFLIFVLLGLSKNVYSQESVNPTGGNLTNGSGSVSYSIGQVFFTSNTNDSSTISQGVQQAYEIYTVDIQLINIDLTISIEPNPTNEVLYLMINGNLNPNLSYQICDNTGKLIVSNLIFEKKTIINLINLASSTYLLNVFDHEKKIRSFKIVKN